MACGGTSVHHLSLAKGGLSPAAKSGEFKMTDTTTNPKIKKVAIAIRDWIDHDGNPLSPGDEAKVAGIRYTHLPSAKKAKPDFNPESETAPDGTFIDYMFTDEVATKMFAAFGAQTLAGNVVNTATNGPKGDKALNPISLIKERFDSITDEHTWADREGGVGVRYDKDKLIQAILNAKKESDETPYRAKLDNKVDPKTGAVVANDTKGAISWGAFVMRNPVVKGEYDKLTGGGVTLDMI
jgi:hypothetical protein